MCQKLVNRVAQSRQLMAVADPDLLVLFEDWLDELENEVVSLAKQRGPFVYYEIADSRILTILEALKELATDLLAARTTF